jgi:hypothetical protein
MSNSVKLASPKSGVESRRGMLLLLVLLMLAIFLALGIFAMTIAMRSRSSARAYVNEQAADAETAVLARSMLDQALMKLVRGPSSPGAMNDIPESLLEDMYCGERDLNRNSTILDVTANAATAVDDVAEVDIDSGKLDIDQDPRKQPTRSDSLTGRMLSIAPAAAAGGPFNVVTVEVYFENSEVDADGLWLASQDLNNNGMYDPRPGVPSPLPAPVPSSLSTDPLSASPPVVFNGRLITFCPPDVDSLRAGSAAVGQVAGRSVEPVTFRILRSQFAGSAPSAPTYRCTYQFVVVGGVEDPLARGPQAPCDVVINAPAFRVDPCDHPAEPWLTRAPDQSGFGGLDVDNDNDGVADGRWLSDVLPMVRVADGRSVRCDVSILVKDLDGRINLNAHGALRRHSQTGRPYRARSEYGYLRRTVPIGMGFGPADIDAGALFSTAPSFVADGSVSPSRGLWADGRVTPMASTWDVLLRGDNDNAVSVYPRPDDLPWLQRRPAPVLGILAGRYSGTESPAVPGVSGQDPLSQTPDAELFVAPYGALVGKANSPGDLKARLQVATQLPSGGKGVSALMFYAPDVDPDIVDDPYEVRLDRLGPRPGGGSAAPDNLFTLAELERVLRQFDPDAAQLAPRLAAALGSRLREDRNEDGVRDNGEGDPGVQDDGEDRATNGKPANGILDKGEDTNSNGFLDLAKDVNGSGFPDTPEDRNQDNVLGRYWPRDAANPPDFPRQMWERDFTQTLRELVTTDSWDTPGATGLAAKRIEKYLIENPQTIPHFSPDSIAGLRFDINRPIPFLFLDLPTGHVYEDRDGDGRLDSGEDRNGNGRLDPFATSNQAYCKHLFYVLTALGVAVPSEAAQWAANIVDFRDADSVMTAFEYDSLPGDGWDVDGDLTTNDGGHRAVVFGTERPELVITEAAAWGKGSPNQPFTQGQIFVMLHRPWNALTRNFVSTTNAIPPQVSQPSMAEPIDVRLTVSATVPQSNPFVNITAARLKEVGDSNSNGVAQEPALDLELRCSGTTNTPVWRLVISPGTPAQKIVRFDNPPTFQPNVEFGASSNRAALRAVTAMPSNSYVCVASGAPQEGITVTGSMFAIDSGSLFVTTPGNTVIELQRLADPWGPYDSVINPHVPVDRFTVRNIDRSLDPNTMLPKKQWQMTKRAWNEPKLGEEFDVPIGQRDAATRTMLTNFWRSTRVSNASPRLIPPDLTDGADPQYPGRTLPPAPGGAGDTPPSLGPLDFVAPWLHWPNRPFISVGELLLVPRLAAADWLQGYKVPCVDPGPQGDTAEQCVFDACHVYSRFTGNRLTLTGSNNLALIGAERIPFDQLSSWREPGRVNLYTGGASPVIRALVAGRVDGRASSPFEYEALKYPDSVDSQSVRSPTMRPTAALLCNKINGEIFMDTSPEYAILKAGVVAPPDKDDHVPFNPSLNPFFCFNTAIRMPNVATTRSHVFAVWITVRLTDTADPSKVTFRRLFAIIDRSIPVGFIHGMDLNARDTVLLQRYLD